MDLMVLKKNDFGILMQTIGVCLRISALVCS